MFEPIGRPVRSVPTSTATIIGAHDAKTRLAELLDRVERGEEIVIPGTGDPSQSSAAPARAMTSPPRAPQLPPS